MTKAEKQQALEWECPVCDAKPGEYCMFYTTNRVKPSPHYLRHDPVAYFDYLLRKEAKISAKYSPEIYNEMLAEASLRRFARA